MPLDPQKDPRSFNSTPGRQSIRLKDYNYFTPGGYYVTIVTQKRECLFGEIADAEMQLNPLGKIVQEEWFRTAILRPNVRLYEDEFVVMPNHVHGIIWIIEDIVGAQRRYAPTKTRRAPATKPAVTPGSLGAIVRAFKSAVTYHAGKELNMANLWHRNYGACPERERREHIVRDEDDHHRIYDYILSNPSRWEEDEENPNYR